MLKVWRGKRAIFAECTECGSYGMANHLQPRVRMAPEIEAAVEQHAAHMMALRSHYNAAATSIASQIRSGSLTRPAGSAKIRELWENHVTQVRLGEAGLPSSDGQVTELVANCPWCEAINEEVEVETLPDDAVEPPYEQAQAVAAYHVKALAAEAAQTKKGK